MVHTLFLVVSVLAQGTTEAVVVAPDHSLTTEGYYELGMPVCDRTWAPSDLTKALEVLTAIASKDSTQLPRYESPTSGAVFDRICSEENLAPYRKVGLAVQARLGEAIKLAPGLSGILMLYVNATSTGPSFDSELVSLLCVQLRFALLQYSLVKEFQATLPKNDPKAEARKQGLARMHSGTATMVAGAVETLGERSAYRPSQLLRLARELESLLPPLFDELPRKSRWEIPMRLKGMVAKEADPDIRGALEETLGALRNLPSAEEQAVLDAYVKAILAQDAKALWELLGEWPRKQWARAAAEEKRMVARRARALSKEALVETFSELGVPWSEALKFDEEATLGRLLIEDAKRLLGIAGEAPKQEPLEAWNWGAGCTLRFGSGQSRLTYVQEQGDGLRIHHDYLPECLGAAAMWARNALGQLLSANGVQCSVISKGGKPAFWVRDVAGLRYRTSDGGKPLDLVDEDLARADRLGLATYANDQPAPSRGYWFRIVPLDENRKPYSQITDADGGAWTTNNRFAYCAYPSECGITGTLTIIMDGLGKSYAKDLGETSMEGVESWPAADPLTQGWVEFK